VAFYAIGVLNIEDVVFLEMEQEWGWKKAAAPMSKTFRKII